MKYEISGDSLPVLKIQLTKGESIRCQSGGMSWMDNEIEMKTEFGGVGKMLGRMISRESMALNEYTAKKDGEIAFSSTFPGSIIAVPLTGGQSIIVQKSAFLAMYGSIETSVFFQKKVGSVFFGGEGFIMQQFSGEGMVFLEVDGSAHEYEIAAGDQKILDTGHLVMMDASCSMDIQRVKGVKNMLFGGEGLFNTVVTGPGKILVQSMPASATAMMLYSLMPHPSSS